MSTPPKESESGEDDHEQLTEDNIRLIEHGDSTKQIDSTYAKILNHWDGVRDFNRECTFAHGTDIREHVNKKRWSDSTADYSDYFNKADAATKSVAQEHRSSLKLYRAYQSTTPPLQRFCASTTDWPDRACTLELDEGNKGVAAAVQVEESPAPAEIDNLKRPSDAIEIDDEQNSDGLDPAQRLELKRTLKRRKITDTQLPRVLRSQRIWPRK